jgi:D-alanine-D-alanine ligase
MNRIAIFCGGYSSEFSISIKSAQTIIEHFPVGFDVFKVIVSKEGWYAEIGNERFDYSLDNMGFFRNDNWVKPDAGMVYIHGDPGENGKIQALLELKGIPYINSGLLASALSFDKWYCNQFLKGFGLKVAESVLLYNPADIESSSLIQKLGLPIFIKPADSGSSYGITKVKKEKELIPAVEKAFQEGGSVVAEAFLDGIEVTCGVYRGRNGVRALPLTEISSENEFFDYEAKYDGKSKEITPARVTDEIRDEVQNQSKYIYDLLNLRSVARIDFMLVKGLPYVIEVNTTPGFSSASIVPQMLSCEGTSVTEFWNEIIQVELFNRQ